ncbi:hypothetical protein JN535_04045 [Cellulosimicrobium cellulans]|uniref:hypothetical protein n=1 Tax=Cellulosimicrobium cellulans TaxID=1710 RepID=UPI001964BE10|nr:hypothetical protein [Cellulosimicrobium cellulans]MBN0039345.1 hypothetical protein [Cellulosimicrobium cellulans]
MDQVIPIAATAAYAGVLSDMTPEIPDVRVAFYVGISTLAALAVAAATFVCTMTYQSTGEHMRAVRRHYGEVLRRNWTSILVSTLVAATLPLLAILVDTRWRQAAMLIAVYSLVLVAVRFVRSIYWLRITLFLERAADELPEPMAVKLPPRPARRR